MNRQENPRRKLAIQNTVHRRLLSVEDAATYLGLSPHHLYNRICPKAKDPFPVRPKRYGRRRLFDMKDLDAWADTLSSVEKIEEIER